MWAKSKWFQRLGGGTMEQLLHNSWSRLQMFSLETRKSREDMALLRLVRSERSCLSSAFEAFLILSLSRSQLKVPGDYAEVGVYQGGSARLICATKGARRLKLFDTFTGLPKTCEKDLGIHREHAFACSQESVEGYLQGFDNVTYHKGLFPDSTKGLAEAQYAFVHLDVDLYESTKACLEYFYPRMAPGGVILSHDYSILIGVERAFTEFMADKVESVIEQPTTQCMVVKR
jgi:hypothetical protein